ncbi:MAG: hypothetical protein J5I93_07225 [Pirellulaceae bacterium]|nr:hypothetical protein [Pirellulaceae bacterium]
MAAQPQAAVTQDPGATDGAVRADRGAQQAQAQAERGRAMFWALEGVRSLDIQLTTDMAGRRHQFQSLGVQPRLTARFVDFRRIELPVWSVLALVLLLGVAITGRTVLFKARYLLLVAVLALALPLATPWTIALKPSSEAALIAVGLLVPYYLLAGVVWLCYRGLRAAGRRLPRPTAAGLLGLACLLGGLGGDTLVAQQNQAAPEVLRADQLIESWLSVLRPPAPLIIPADAVVVPYDASAGLAGIQQAQKLLVPYDRYVELWNLAYPDQKLQVPPPLPYAVSSATYEARLEGSEFLLVRGRIVLDLFVDRPVAIPLALRGGALTSATLDGQPARLQAVAPAPPGQQPGPAMQQQMQAPAQQAAIAGPQPVLAAEPLLVLYMSGRGRQQLELSARFRLERQGGWRVAAGHLPLAAATSLDLTVPEPRTDVRLTGVTDRQRYETQEAGELLRTSLASGEFGIQWRPRIAEGQVDQNLTARSDAVLEVQEDGLRLRWNVRLEFRRDRRETFTLSVPAGYLVERVEGENVRGWEAVPRDQRQQLEVTLLKPAAESESLTVELTQRAAIGAEPRAVRVPAIEVTGAVLHQGQLLIRRSPLLELRTLAVNGATRTDATATPLAQAREESPLGLIDFQAFRFAATPFEIELQASPVETNVAARWQSILRIAPRELQLESRINLRVRNRPLYKLELSLPAELRLDQVGLPDNSEWSERIVDGRKRLTVLLKSGVLGDVALLLGGRLDRAAGQATVDLPQLAVLDVSPQQGDFAVQIDPAFDVVPRQLDGCQTVLPGQVHVWLNESQRAATQLAVRWDRPGYAGQLQVRARQPQATVLAVANVRVTERTIEETLLLDFTIRDAGIRQIQFLLPDWMRDARIDVPLLRQKTIEPVEDAGRPLPHAAMIRVRLELQDELIGQVRVLIQNDRLLSDQVQSAPLVVVETGTTEQRFVTLESAGRDEVVVSQLEGLEELTREQQDWRRLAGLLGDKLTRAYLVRGDAQRPGLEFQTKTRRAVETPTARIGLGTTLLVVDAYGAYRGEQTYRVENATEQFLEIELPVGTELWTVHVAGEPVKPTEVPGGNSDRLVRVPIIKTDVGDDDYPVTLKYGGRMTGLGTLTQVAFPLLRTRNITVELSQVSLRLPEEYRWFNFGGSMRRVLDRAELQAGYFEYKTRQIQNWTEALSSSNPFTRARASSNLKQLTFSLHSLSSDIYGEESNEFLRKKAAESLAALQQAEARLEVTESRESVTMSLDNRSQLNYLWNEQSNQRATNVVTQLGRNFDQPVQSAAPQPADDTRFNRRWLDQNALRNPMADKEATAGDRISGKAQAQLPASKPSASSSSQLLGLDDQAQLAKQQEFDRSELEERSKFRDQTTQALERYRQQLDEGQLGRMVQRGAGLNQPMPQTATLGGRHAAEESLAPPAGPGFAGSPRSDFAGQQGGGQVANAPGLSTRGEVADAELPAVELSDADAHLASLDIQLAQRGTLYNFTARDQIEIEAQMVPSDLAGRAVRLFGIGVAAIMLGLVLRWLGRRRRG